MNGWVNTREAGDLRRHTAHYDVTVTHYSSLLVSQMRAPLAACREPAGKLWQLCKVLYMFEHKTQYLLIHAPNTRIVVFSHIGNVPPYDLIELNLL